MKYMQRMINWAIKLGLLGALGIVVLIWVHVYQMLTI
jgi:hypothetical protein